MDRGRFAPLHARLEEKDWVRSPEYLHQRTPPGEALERDQSACIAPSSLPRHFSGSLSHTSKEAGVMLLKFEARSHIPATEPGSSRSDHTTPQLCFSPRPLFRNWALLRPPLSHLLPAGWHRTPIQDSGTARGLAARLPVGTKRTGHAPQESSFDLLPPSRASTRTSGACALLLRGPRNASRTRPTWPPPSPRTRPDCQSTRPQLRAPRDHGGARARRTSRQLRAPLRLLRPFLDPRRGRHAACQKESRAGRKNPPRRRLRLLHRDPRRRLRRHRLLRFLPQNRGQQGHDRRSRRSSRGEAQFQT
mmetsp:Transcript_14607/g.55209  ORF Transcript_14607/g.55209 Transcript_14607/m.55209 type:complete len:305 (-) Transcript_14607:2115-3029(-)